MRPVEIVGALIVSATCATAWWLGHVLPSTAPIGQLLAWGAALLLAQVLVRDSVLLLGQRRLASLYRSADRHPREAASIGLLVLLAVALLGLSSVAHPVSMSPARWAVAALVVLGSGFAVQDFVVNLRPFRIHHDPRHTSIARLFRRL